MTFNRSTETKSACVFFFFNDTATTEIYTLSLHDALPIFTEREEKSSIAITSNAAFSQWAQARSEEHTSELQSQSNLVCRLLLEKKKAPPAIAPSKSHIFSSKISRHNCASFLSVETAAIIH